MKKQTHIQAALCHHGCQAKHTLRHTTSTLSWSLLKPRQPGPACLCQISDVAFKLMVWAFSYVSVCLGVCTWSLQQGLRTLSNGDTQAPGLRVFPLSCSSACSCPVMPAGWAVGQSEKPKPSWDVLLISHMTMNKFTLNLDQHEKLTPCWKQRKLAGESWLAVKKCLAFSIMFLNWEWNCLQSCRT